MNNELAVGIIRRFIKLPLDKRKQYLQQMLAEGVSPANLPIPELRSGFERLPLSYAQQRQWLLWQLDPQSAAYHIPTVLRLQGHLQVAALEAAFAALVTRHETLRTTFALLDDQPVQQVHESLLPGIQLDAAVDAARLPELIAAEIRRPFDLQHGPLLRLRLLAQGEQEHVLILTLHHIVADGWSMPLMVEELVQLYQGQLSGSPVELPPLAIQYADYAIWQRRWMEAGEQERQLAYWQGQLGGEQPVLELPLDRPRPAVQDLSGARLGVELEPALSARLKGLAQEQGVTLFMLLLASFQALLYRYCGQSDIRVGVPAANRTRVETERLIGFFVNTQVLKAEFDVTTTVVELLAQVKRTALEAQAHQELPFEQLVEALQPQRSLSHTPLFQVMFNHQTQVKGAARELSGLRLENLGWEAHSAQFDLTLETFEGPQGLFASLHYATALFDRSTVEELAVHWQQLLRAMVSDVQQRVADLPMLEERQQQRVLQDWNSTTAAYPSEQCLHALIEAQAARTPDATALLFGEQHLSYALLNLRANQVARQLRERGVGPDVLVGIAAERSMEMVVGLLAILKAGGAYVPLDPDYPRERLSYMIEDSSVRLLLTQSHLRGRLPIPEGVECLLLEDAGAGYPVGNLQHQTSPANLAYVIYTSGSTGRPKGAGNSHQALVNRLHWMQKAYGLDGSDTVLQKTPFSFDVSVWEFFWPLLSGARLALAQPGDHRDPQKLIECIHDFQVSTLHFVPSMLQAFMASPGVEGCSGIRRLICSGEALAHELAQQVLARLPNAALYNLYGPTEAAIDVTHWTCAETDDSVPIGRPIDNLKTHVLSPGLLPVPQGVNSELYLGGVGLARGYHGRPGLTAERFVPDPFDDQGGRLYRTGDLARYRADGAIEYAGRLDHQVKIRGLRIELGEIDARAQEYPQVREAVVIDIDGPLGKQLVGYLVPREEGADPREGLKAHLKAGLPDYMVPAQWLLLEAMPLSPNGKLDRKALPSPDSSLLHSLYVEPETELQQQLAAIWADVLKVERVGLNDNFFELGGDSIISIQAVSRARQTGIHLTPKQLFQYQTIAELALHAALKESAVLEREQGLVNGASELTPIQHWFLDSPIPQRDHWNQSVLLGSNTPLNSACLEQALQAVYQHHDALRLRVVPDGSQWSGRYDDSIEPAQLWCQTLADPAQLEALFSKAQSSLDLARGPLMRVVLATLPDGQQRLLWVIHHLLVDGVSWRILLEDLQSAYQQRLAGKLVELAAKTSSFKAWAERIQQYSREESCLRQAAFWQQQLSDLPLLPGQHGTGPGCYQSAATVTTVLDSGWTKKLLQLAPKAYRTRIDDLLLTALARVICRWTGAACMGVRLEGHGREELFDELDVTRTVGWFTAMYPVKLSPAQGLGVSIKNIKEQLRAVPDKGLGFGALRYFADEEIRQALGVAQPEILFNYLGQLDQSFSASDALLTPAAGSRGGERDEQAPLDGLLSINGRVYKGTLSLDWTFSDELFQVSAMQDLADQYAEELQQLIGHCCEIDRAILTPSDVAIAGLSQTQLDEILEQHHGVEDIYPLSPMQEGLFFHSHFSEGGGDYVNQLRVDISGLDIPRFKRAWQSVFDRHEVLRTAFVGTAQAPLQVVRSGLELPFAELDWAGLTHQQERCREWAANDQVGGFALDRAPLFRLTVIHLGGNDVHFVYSSHHILMDGWSQSRLLGEVIQTYAGQALSAPRVRYRHYIDWLKSPQRADSSAFWAQQLSRLAEPTRLAQVFAQPPLASALVHHKRLQRFSPDFTRRLGRFAREQRVTANTLVQAAWALLLQRLTGNAEVVFGATVSGRPAGVPYIEEAVGLFINTLPVVASPRPEQSVAAWLQELQALNLLLREHEQTPLYKAQQSAGQGNASLFDTLLVFENYPISEAFKNNTLEGVDFAEVVTLDQTHYALTVIVGLGEVLSISYEFNNRVLSEDAVDLLQSAMACLLAGLIESPDQSLGNLSLLGAADNRLLIEQLNPRLQLEPARSLADWFEAQVGKTPDALALIDGAVSLTYGELNQRANRLAHQLGRMGAGADVKIAVALPRSADLVVSLLAILKSGSAYVPLDPSYPPERIHYMLEDSRAALVLTCFEVVQTSGLVTDTPLVLLEQLDLVGSPVANPARSLAPHNLAYIIYTSGSTGMPKGVLIEQRNVDALMQWAADVYTPGDLQGVLASTSVCFDLSVWEIFVTLGSGGYFVLAENALALPDLPGKDQVTLINTVPSAIRALLDAQAIPRSVRTINLAGEALEQQLVERIYQQGQVERVYDLYGPSEDTTYSTCTLRSVNGAANIGRPIKGGHLYILDSVAQPSALGNAGEIYLGGDGLARGYQGKPGQTAEKFLPSPFGLPGERMYRTGDMGCFDNEGVVRYCGRIDHQVKIRGFRIELGEISAQLQADEAVHQAAVIDVASPLGKQLAGYVVPAVAGSDPREALRARLKAALPDYMQPSHLILLEQLPLTANGKLDRKALPVPDFAAMQAHYLEPQSALQRQLATIWAEVLHVERVGLNDSFFALGGHSLLATQVISRVRLGLNVEVPLKALFEAADLGDFACRVEGSQQSSAPPIQRIDRSADLALSAAQQRQWFLWQLEPDSAAYNIPAALRLKGELDLPALAHSFVELIERHEPLRTTFAQAGEQPVQLIHAHLPLDLLVDDSAGVDLHGWVAAEIQRPFDLEKGPLLRVRLLRLSAVEHVLVLTLHHIVADGWSMPLMVDELVQLYQGFHEGQPVALAPLPIQYADFAAWQRQWMAAGEQQRQLTYWRQQLGDEPGVLELPLDRPRPAIQDHRGACLAIELGNELSLALKSFARQQGVTLFVLLLASFQALLQRYSGQNDIRVGVPIANRTRLETEKLIGFFVNTQVLKAGFDAQLTVAELLAQVRDTALQAQAHQDLPFEQLVEALQPERSMSRTPLFQVMFNHQTQVKGIARQLPGLQVEALEWAVQSVPFDLSLDTCEQDSGLSARLSYATALFDEATMLRMAGHWRALLAAMLGNAQGRVAELPVMAAGERVQLLQRLDQRNAIGTSQRGVHELIQEQAASKADALALICDGQSLTYAELNRRANRIAHQLRELGVGPDVLVGLAVQRSLDMVVALLAVLKAGGAYVPLDPDYPAERLGYMIEDSGLGLLLVHEHLRARLHIPGTVTCLTLESAGRGYPDTDPVSLTQPRNLAYVMYTSGSTGRPKGVAIDHACLSTHTRVTVDFAGLTAADRVLQFATFNFDAFVEQLYPALTLGASVVIRGPTIWDSETFYRQLLANDISVVDLATAYWFMLVKDFARIGPRPYGRLRQLHIGGEAMPAEGIEAWKQAGLERVTLINTYGPTEATVVASTYDCRALIEATAPAPASVPIGDALPGRVIHIVDAQAEAALPGTSGELMIGGELLARGYFQRPGLTAERFIPDPFDASGGRLYRTGDLARYDATGELSYAGRIDHQVKIRGFRIELGEIEARIQACQTVREVLVLAVDRPLGKELVAYIVAAVEGDDPRTALRAALKQHLPDYMVPGHWLLLPAMPLSPNGKLDRKALPAPDLDADSLDFRAPQSALEVDVARVWAQTLLRERISLNDNFFELGGHSLLAARMISTIRAELGLDVPLRLLFESPCLSDFVQAIQTQATGLSETGLAEIEQMMNEWAEV